MHSFLNSTHKTQSAFQEKFRSVATAISFPDTLSQPMFLTNTRSLSYKHLLLARSSCDNRKKMCSRHNRRHTFQRCHGPDFCQEQPFFQSCKPHDSQPGLSISSTGLPTLNHRGNYLDRDNDITDFLKIKLVHMYCTQYAQSWVCKIYMNTGKFCGWVYTQAQPYHGKLYHAHEMLWNGKMYS